MLFSGEEALRELLCCRERKSTLYAFKNDDGTGQCNSARRATNHLDLESITALIML